MSKTSAPRSSKTNPARVTPQPGASSRAREARRNALGLPPVTRTTTPYYGVHGKSSRKHPDRDPNMEDLGNIGGHPFYPVLKALGPCLLETGSLRISDVNPRGPLTFHLSIPLDQGTGTVLDHWELYRASCPLAWTLNPDRPPVIHMSEVPDEPFQTLLMGRKDAPFFKMEVWTEAKDRKARVDATFDLDPRDKQSPELAAFVPWVEKLRDLLYPPAKAAPAPAKAAPAPAKAAKAPATPTPENPSPAGNDLSFEGEITVLFEYPGMAGFRNADGSPSASNRLPAVYDGLPALYEEMKKSGLPLHGDGSRVRFEFRHLVRVLSGLIFTLKWARPRLVSQTMGSFDPIVNALWGKTWMHMQNTMGTPLCPVEADAPDELLNELQTLQDTLLTQAATAPAIPPFTGRYVSFTAGEVLRNVLFPTGDPRHFSYVGSITLILPMKWKGEKEGVDAALVRSLFAPLAPYLMRPSITLNSANVANYWYDLLSGSSWLPPKALDLISYWHKREARDLSKWIAPHIAEARAQVPQGPQRYRCEFNPEMIEALAGALAKRFGLPLPPSDRTPATRNAAWDVDLLRALGPVMNVLEGVSNDDLQTSLLDCTEQNRTIVHRVLMALRECSPLSPC